jgi:hypothetical protein
MQNRSPSASCSEIVAAVVSNKLPQVMLAKRLTLLSAESALRELEGFVGPGDSRLEPLREQVAQLTAAPLRTRVARKPGESVVYKTQRPSTKKSPHVIVPVNVLEQGAPLDKVRVTFGTDRIVIERITNTSIPPVEE